MTDPNGNRVAATFDAMGMVVATAVMGKEGESVGDLLEDFDANPSLADLQAFVADPTARSASLLGKASTRIVYDLERFQRAGQPPFAATLARETHFHDPGGAQTKIQFGFTYSDGFGREIQKKIRAEAGEAPQRQADVQLPSGDIRPGELIRDDNGKPVLTNAAQRWVGTGRTVFNDKGKPVRQYEPFFSATHLFEEEREMTDTGVSPVLFYDPVERVIATLNPNHTYAKIVFDPWQQTTYDVNDTVVASGLQTGDPRTDPDIAGFVREYFKIQPVTWQTWHAQRIGNQLGTPERDAAQKAAAHADTPTVTHLDALGRPFLTIAHNKFDRRKPDDTIETIEEKYSTRVELDIEGNQRAVIDAKDRVVMRYDYDLLGSQIHQASMEAGERWMLGDVTGNPIRAWDSRGHNFVTTYDALRRPVEQRVMGTTAESDPRTLNRNLLIDKIEYGESQDNAERLNLRTRIYRHSDSAGVVTNAQLDDSGDPTESYDFKGNLLRSTRQLAQDYKSIPDWSANPELEQETFTSSNTYDALNRPVSVTAPDNSVYRPTFNEGNLLEKVDVNLRGASVATPFVANIDYDAKGQRTLIDYDNGARTTYSYDTETFRLIHLYTRRSAAFTEDCENPQPPPATSAAPDVSPPNTPCGLQNLQYTYDPAGNITQISDTAQQTIFFNNQVVTPSNDYVYDAVYRLIKAEGREHIGQVTQPQTTRDDEFRVNLRHPNDGRAMRRYTEFYEYDGVGNFRSLVHEASEGTWRRSYDYSEVSLIEPVVKSNRLSSTTVGSNTSIFEPYQHDAHGNMTDMPHLTLMRWDFRDQLSATSRQVRNNGTPETTFYLYDAAGQRVRKVIEGQNGKRKKERIYFGGFEVFREYDADGTSITLERETLHVMDDRQRIALVETRTQGTDSSPAQLIRYQFVNHLGSASLELDQAGQIISYEECYPYGSTSYQAVRKDIQIPPKRYRYTGMERDEESGLGYHGARYYTPWLGSWISCDPAGAIDSYNLYAFCRHNPIVFVDLEGTNSDKAITQLQDAREELNAEIATKAKITQEINNQENIKKQASQKIDKAYKELSELDSTGRSIKSVEKETERLNNIIEENTKRHAGAKAKLNDATTRLSDTERKIGKLRGKTSELYKKLGQRANKAADADLRKAEDALKPKGTGGWWSKLTGKDSGSGPGSGGSSIKTGKSELMNNQDVQDLKELTGNKITDIEAEIENQEQWGVGMLVGLASGPVGAFRAVLADPERLPRAVATIMVSPGALSARGGIQSLATQCMNPMKCLRKPTAEEQAGAMAAAVSDVFFAAKFGARAAAALRRPRSYYPGVKDK